MRLQLANILLTVVWRNGARHIAIVVPRAMVVAVMVAFATALAVAGTIVARLTLPCGLPFVLCGLSCI